MLLLSALYFVSSVYAQAYHDFNIYVKSGSTFTYNKVEFDGKYPKTDEGKKFLGYFDTYVTYSLFYNAFYLSFAPEFKMEESEPHLLLKKFILSYSFDTLDLSIGKTSESRYLTKNRDYLTVPNRPIRFDDEFSFWKFSMYIPTEYVSFDLGSKVIREKDDYRFEWKYFENILVKPYVYTYFDYRNFSSHLGYAYTYKTDTKDSFHDITGKIFYTYNDIITGYFANLISFEQEKAFSLDNYSYTIGSEFSFVNAFVNSSTDYDVKIATEIVYENEKHSIIPSLLFFYDEFVFSDIFSYNFENKDIENTVVIQYTVSDFTFSIFHSLFLSTRDTIYSPGFPKIPQSHDVNVINTIVGLELVYEM